MKKLVFTLILSSICLPIVMFGQTYFLHKGWGMPMNEPEFKVLIVFAEMEYNSCPTFTPPGGFKTDGEAWDWPKDPITSETLVPTWANNLLDASYTPGTTPTGSLTRYFADISFGKFSVVGDFYPNVLTIPCDILTGPSASSATGGMLTAFENDVAGLSNITLNNGTTLLRDLDDYNLNIPTSLIQFLDMDKTDDQSMLINTSFIFQLNHA